jgi:hypothetical protein
VIKSFGISGIVKRLAVRYIVAKSINFRVQMVLHTIDFRNTFGFERNFKAGSQIHFNLQRLGFYLRTHIGT